MIRFGLYALLTFSIVSCVSSSFSFPITYQRSHNARIPGRRRCGEEHDSSRLLSRRMPDEMNSDKSPIMQRKDAIKGLSLFTVFLLISRASNSITAPNPTFKGKKSRTEGYAFQRTDEEWSKMLSPVQYDILRLGGTERPYSSILENEKRAGTFVCAGCGTPLFSSSAKFKSGTGWPSFASALEGVEVEDVTPIQAGLLGAELRCHTCGGHLGDVFGDGALFVGTPAFKTGKRFCIDGAALVFRPESGDEVRGDLSPGS